MQTLVLLIYLVSCLILILVILLQSGKSADLASAFGVMGSQTAFGPRGTATLLSKLTTGAAIVFMVTALTLSLMMSGSSGGSSIMDRAGDKAAGTKPAGATTPTPKKQPAPATAQPTPATSQPGAPTVEFDGASGGVQNVEVKQLTPQEAEALLKAQKAPAAQPKQPTSKPAETPKK